MFLVRRIVFLLTMGHGEFSSKEPCGDEARFETASAHRARRPKFHVDCARCKWENNEKWSLTFSETDPKTNLRTAVFGEKLTEHDGGLWGVGCVICAGYANQMRMSHFGNSMFGSRT